MVRLGLASVLLADGGRRGHGMTTPIPLSAEPGAASVLTGQVVCADLGTMSDLSVLLFFAHPVALPGGGSLRGWNKST